ncbi:copper amine oxidase N-terminal domain-containing protein [Paenibacillus tritici]|uniref:copper amine oxidase N-terminal domain-containing protein n=1 Tax=Paenibacillus tritici TaxID=1873425 RepID=UPI001BA9640F|nr:copper amine oxidase N-terminal domain-containing protein [Paenibacillus tritici]QUL55513.1 copper amine oxidase N-terminal domain-containing protein [Paenibacillus tritici]
MKRWTKIGISAALFTTIFSAGAYAATAVPKIFVNGNQVKSSLQPKIIDGSVYIPIRAVSEGLGADIQWDNKAKNVYVDSDPNFKMETSATAYVFGRNLAFKWIMAYDERSVAEANALVAPSFKTDIYKESFPGGTYNLATIVDMKVVARSEIGLTVRIVQRVTAEDDYKVKVEKWDFIFENNKIKSVKVVPKSTKYLDRYTLFPGTSFGI